jgi:hypothetical protein
MIAEDGFEKAGVDPMNKAENSARYFRWWVKCTSWHFK